MRTLVYRSRIRALVENLPKEQIDELLAAAMQKTGDNYEDYWIREEVGIRNVLWQRLSTPVNEKANVPLSLDEALLLAKQAQVLVNLASNLVHQVATSRVYLLPDPNNTERLPRKIESEAADAEKRIRDAGQWLGFNFGLIDQLRQAIRERDKE